MAQNVLSITQLNEYIRGKMDTDPLLTQVAVRGEISNYKLYPSGHHYFTLKDEASALRCVLFKGNALKLRFRPENGMKIIAMGKVSVYPRDGAYQLYCTALTMDGVGDLYAAFEQLKKKLAAQGLFDPAHKKPIAAFPYKIGIITSRTGAAVQDILKIITTRTKMVDVNVFPVLVQGKDAAQDIADTLDFINKNHKDIDVLIVGRGGGSTEDLWAFNEEVLARAVFRSEIPVISAVGHEIDFTICDFVADYRAETPTAAAEKAVPNDEILQNRIDELIDNISSDLKSKVLYSKTLTDRYADNMKLILLNRIDRLFHQIEQNYIILKENNPLNILNKGYSVLENKEGRVISSISELQDNSTYILHLKDGTAQFTITKLSKEGE